MGGVDVDMNGTKMSLENRQSHHSSAQAEVVAELPLFRQQVQDAKLDRFAGPIILVQPISRKLVTATSFLVITGLVLFMGCATVNRTAHVAGVTVPIDGALPVISPAAGIITDLRAKEGERVRKGQVLFQVSNEQMSQGGDTIAMVAAQLTLRRQALESQLSSRLRQFEEDRAGLLQRLRNSELEEEQLREEIALAKNRMQFTKTDLQNYDTLRQAGFISQAQKQQKEQELLDVIARYKVLERSLTVARRGRIELNDELTSSKSRLDIEESQIRSSVASIDQQLIENNAKKSTLILAAQDGVIATINVKLGQMAGRERSLAILIPNRLGGPTVPTLEVQLFIPSQTIGFVETGQNVLMRFPAYPYQLFGLRKGTVIDVSQTPLAASELPDLVAGTVLSNSLSGGVSREGLYRVRVALDSQSVTAYGRRYLLRPGMALEADVVRERQKVWELFFSPALAMIQKNS